MEVLVVSASRLGAGGESPYSIAVLGAGRVEGARDLGQALSGLSEVFVQAPGGRAGFGSAFLRGADPNFSSLMFDGVALNAPTNSRGGAYNVSELSVAGLDRVEVVAGPLSSLYGSGGVAGGVNLAVSAGAEFNQFSLSASGGERGDHQWLGHWRGPLGPGLGASLAVESSNDGEGEGAARFRSSSVVGKLAVLDDPDAGHVTVRLARTRASAFPDNSGGFRLAALRDLERRESQERLIGLEKRVLQRGSTSLTLTGAYLDREDDIASPGVAPSAFDPFGVPRGFDAIRYRRGEAGATMKSSLLGGRAALGFAAQREEGEDRGALVVFGFPSPTDFKLERTTYSAFAETNRSTGAWSANTGLRLDKIDGFGPRVTARAGVRYAVPASGLAVRAAAGTGFKAPSFYALGNPFVGNPGLRPERSQGGEMGLGWTGDYVRADLTVFETRYKGLIDFVPVPAPHLENRDEVRAAGVSFTLDAALGPQLQAQAQATYVNTRDTQTKAQLLTRPRSQLTAGLRYRPRQGLGLSARIGHVGERQDYSTPTGPVTLKAYTAVDLGADKALGADTRLRLDIDNLLDKRHEDAVGFPSPGRNTRLSLTKDF